MRRIAVLLGGLLITWFAMTGAHAHAELVSMDPAAGTTVTSQLEAIRLTFGEDITTLGTTVVVLDPAGNDINTGVTIQGPVVSVSIGTLSVGGEYRVNYRVNSVDGHIVEGSEVFTYQDPSESPTPMAIATIAAGDGDDDGGMGEAGEVGEFAEGGGSGMLVLGLLALALVGGVAYAIGTKRNASTD